MRFNLPKELGLAMTDALSSQLPWLKLGSLTLEGRDDYYDFSYHGNGKLPVGVCAAMDGVGWGKRTNMQRLENLLDKLDDEMVNHITRVTFHELGHLVNLAFEGNEHRATLYNYGYEDGIPSRRAERQVGYRIELRTIAVQHFMQDQLGWQSHEMNVNHVYERTSFDMPGTLSKHEIIQTYEDMRFRMTRSYINEAIKVISYALDSTKQPL